MITNRCSDMFFDGLLFLRLFFIYLCHKLNEDYEY